jgi:uncharacterized protein (DUF58 family)
MAVPERGAHVLPPILVRSRFPQGVLETAAEFSRPGELVVLPRLGDIRGQYLFKRRSLEQNVLRHSVPQDRQIEFFGLREYRHGDSYRHIHWRTSARRQQLHVKEFERQEGKNVLILLDSFVPKGRNPRAAARADNFELAISFVATLAGRLLEEGSFYGFAAFCPEFRAMHFDVGQGHYYHVLEMLARMRPNRYDGLVELLDQLDIGLYRNGLILAVSLGDVPERHVHYNLRHQAILIDASSPEFRNGFIIP